MSKTANNKLLRDVFTTHKILVDTCFLMHKNFDQFLADYHEIFQQNPILIPRKVAQELQKIEKKKDHRLEITQMALRSVEKALADGTVEIRGEHSDDHTLVADHVISRVVEQHIAQHNILVLTNDRALALWIYSKKKSGCFSSRNSLLVVRFGSLKGAPQIWGLDKSPNKTNSPYHGNGGTPTVPIPRTPRPRTSPSPNIPQPFAWTTKLENDLETLLPAKEDVEKSGCVYLYDGRQIRLIKKLASGGEGTVYETDQSNVLCKIYHSSRLTDGARRKIELMVTRRVFHPAISWPTDAVRDSQGIFRGFLMPRAFGEPLGHGLFIPPVWSAKHPNWTRKESVHLAIQILEGIHYLHQMKVLLGDINPMNILVKDENTVFFVDCDSFQVEGFPCPVGSINFVAPEIQGQDFARFLRTPEHELFAVATLAFMILMPGKPPYSHQGGADGAANIKKMHFPYPLGEKASAGAPEGAWRFCWSHLSRSIKESFHQTFHTDFQGQARVRVNTWIRLFREYERILNKDSAVFLGPIPQYGFDLSIFPHNFRYVEGKGRPLPTGGETDLQRSVRRMASVQPNFNSKPQPTQYNSPRIMRTKQLPRNTIRATNLGPAEWYATFFFWPFVAPIKALLEIATIGMAGAILVSIIVGMMMMTFGNYDGFGYGARFGFLSGLIVGLFLAGYSITKVDGGIFAAGGIGLVAGAIGVGLYYGSSDGAFAGAALGMVVGLFVRHLQIGERKAADYMHSWWGR
jgi:serine/threonine protein kinase/rRNA-processing protein FCF1